MDHKLQIVTDYNAGLTIKEICKRYKISHMTVYRALKTIVETEEMCSVCRKRDETVHKIICGYQKIATGEEIVEVICDHCEQEHLLNV